MFLDRSVLSYLVVDTLMLGACGVFDLFWWSILGEMLDMGKNPAKVLGIGLSANVLGVLLGGLIGNAITAGNSLSTNSTMLALSVVCVTLVMLPPLHRQLTVLLKDHAYLTILVEMPIIKQNQLIQEFSVCGRLTERESEIAALLLKGLTYRMIAGELHVSENTVRTHIKNIYSKFGVQSKMELMNHLLKK
jgi:DNA-binding CsgD family transcriptional regulator